MTKEDAAATVSTLMEERRQFEAWLAALDARKASTSEHVFTRVQADYAARLDAVMSQLSTHTAALRAELEKLSARLQTVEVDRTRATDERAEFELRAHVGELSSIDWDKHSTAIDVRLAEYDAKHVALEEELRRTKDLLDGAQRPSAALQAIGDESGPEIEAPMAEVAAPASIAGAVTDPRASTPEPEIPIAPEPVVELTPPVAEPRRSGAAPRSAGFDELAFLSSVVDTPSGSLDAAPKERPDERSRRDSFAMQGAADAVVNLSSELTPARQLAAIEVEKEGDELLARSAPPDGQKTLKCGACGAMNYPTEWYCESCGSELASL